MRRVAFTIVLNGLKHLTRNDKMKWMSETFDEVVVVEGACGRKSKDSWYNPIPEKFHHNGSSIDGTVEFLSSLPHKNITVLHADKVWDSKLEMVNSALGVLVGAPAFLWEVDADEYWRTDDIARTEKELMFSGADCSRHYMNTYCGPGLLVKGMWGEALSDPVRRCWIWNGSSLFSSHSPPILHRSINNHVNENVRFEHYSYYYREDVEFKDSIYKGHGGMLQKWDALQKATDFPRPICDLLTGPRSTLPGEIIKIKRNKNENS